MKKILAILLSLSFGIQADILLSSPKVNVNDQGQFFLGKRIGAQAWQFPQGGIDEGEKPEEALYRELYEETGIKRDKVVILSVSQKWLVYHIPHVYQRFNKKYDGTYHKEAFN